MKLILASRNTNKVREIKSMLGSKFQVLSLSDLPFKGEIQETASTIEENSMIKARKVYEVYRIPCIGDDSGLEVDALDGKPGVRSARYAGDQRDDKKNIQKLLKQLSKYPSKTARFKCVISYVDNYDCQQFTGIVKGVICSELKGDNGFGYDPIFIPENHDRTFAQMDTHVKNFISHRSQAIKKFARHMHINKT